MTAQIQRVPHPNTAHWRHHSAIMTCSIPVHPPPPRGRAWGCRAEKEKEERKTKASSIFKAAASLHRGPGWRCKPARLIETKLQVQREVIRKPPSGSMLLFKFHLIKPKEKKPLSLLSPSRSPLLPTEQKQPVLCQVLPSLFLSPLPGRGKHPSHPSPSSYVFSESGWPGLSSLHQQVPHPIPAQETTQTPTVGRGLPSMGPGTDG